MNGSGRRSFFGLLPLLLFVVGCTDPVVVVEEPAAVETCEWLIPVGIELVNDYAYTLAETNLGEASGDVNRLPTSIIALNARGEELDRRAAELECDLAQLNQGIVAATEGLQSTDPVVQVFLETVRAGVVGPPQTPEGGWVLEGGVAAASAIEPMPNKPITLVVDQDGSGSGSTVCNQYFLSIVTDGTEWESAEFSITAAGCPDPSESALDKAYVDALVSVDRYQIDDDTLVLAGPDVELRFLRQASPAAVTEESS